MRERGEGRERERREEREKKRKTEREKGKEWYVYTQGILFGHKEE
jgi:hypothetical protein